MPSPGRSTAREGPYTNLISEDGCDDLHTKPDVGPSVRPVIPVRPSSPRALYLTILCLASLCVILLISLISISAQRNNKPQNSNEATAQMQKQTQAFNVSALNATIAKMQMENEQLRKEKEELQSKLDAAMKAIKPTTKPTTKAPVVCPENWHLFNDSCFFISRVRETWSDSQAFCARHGGHLAIIHTAEEQTFVWNLLPRAYWNAFWIGITDNEVEDEWKWVDGSPLVGGFWEEGEPNNHIKEDCVYIVKTQVLERVPIRSWYDAPCGMSCKYICEKEM